MAASSDLALLSSAQAQLDELIARVTAVAERYGATPDSAVASDLYAAERSLVIARRSLERAAAAIGGS